MSEGAGGGAGEEEEDEAAGVVASEEVLEQLLQVCEQDMNAADGAVAELRKGGVQAGKRKRESEAVEVFAAEAEAAAVRWMAAEEEVVAVEAKAAAERWLAALFCRWLKEWVEGAATEGMTWVVATVSRVVEAAAGATEAAPCLLERAGETRTAVVQQADEEVDAPLEGVTGDMGVAWKRRGMCGERGEKRQQLRQQKRELASQPVRHSLWEQDSLEALNELLGGLDGEVEALQQRKAEYDEDRGLSDVSDSCWDHSGSDSGNVTELEVGNNPALGHLQPGGEASVATRRKV